MITNELIEDQIAMGCPCVVHVTMFVQAARWWQEGDECWTATLFQHFVADCPFQGFVTFTEITVLEQCDFCESTRDVREFDGHGDMTGKKVLLCAVDANTHGGNNHMYNRMYADSSRVMRHISATTNMILDAIEKGQS